MHMNLSVSQDEARSIFAAVHHLLATGNDLSGAEIARLRAIADALEPFIGE